MFYRDGLESGEYSVSLAPLEGYELPAELSFQVIGKRAYVPIADVREQAEVKTVTELPREEVKPAPVETPAETVVESISTEAAPAAATPAPAPAPAPSSGDEVIIIDDEPEPEPEPEPEISYNIRLPLLPNKKSSSRKILRSPSAFFNGSLQL